MPVQSRRSRPRRQGQSEQVNEERAVTRLEDEKRRMREITSLVADRQAQLTALLAGSMDVDRFITVALQAVQSQPALLRATPLSILSAIRDAATYGLEPAGMLGDAAIVAYRDTASNQEIAQLQIEYRGLRKLALRDGGVRAIDADLVYVKDEFAIYSGSEQRVGHLPSLEADRGTVRGGYGWARLANGEFLYLWMPLADILKRRDKSKAWKRAEREKKNDSIWHLWPDEQMRKTVLRRFILEKLPMSPLAREAIAADTMADVESDRSVKVLPSTPAGSDARQRLLSRMGLGDAKQVGPGSGEPASQGETGQPDAKANGDAQSGGNGESGDPGPSAGLTVYPPTDKEPDKVSERTAMPLCDAVSPYDGKGCRKMKGHESSDEPGAKMHRGASGETWT